MPELRGRVEHPAQVQGQEIPCPHCKVEMHVPEAEVLSAPEPFWTARRVVLGLTFWAFVLSCCCGVPTWAWWKTGPLREADRLYDEGRKAEAVAKYQEMWENSGAKTKLLKRIVEYHLETNNEAEATRWVEKGLDGKTPENYEARPRRRCMKRSRRGVRPNRSNAVTRKAACRRHWPSDSHRGDDDAATEAVTAI